MPPMFPRVLEFTHLGQLAPTARTHGPPWLYRARDHRDRTVSSGTGGHGAEKLGRGTDQPRPDRR